MNGAEVMDVGRDALWLTIQLCAPALIVALLVGGLIAFSFHAHEQRQKFLKANPSKDRSKKGKKWHKRQKEKGKL